MCMENHVPMAVFSLNEENGIINAMQGKINGNGSYRITGGLYAGED